MESGKAYNLEMSRLGKGEDDAWNGGKREESYPELLLTELSSMNC